TPAADGTICECRARHRRVHAADAARASATFAKAATPIGRDRSAPARRMPPHAVAHGHFAQNNTCEESSLHGARKRTG
ncbi:hypothetical protein, partial [Burkholderia territorii]|uniref:hypothetical protein n=1 Tax=Burkholderia territorii TaxID=1503055 RepID=UPI001BA8B5FF